MRDVKTLLLGQPAVEKLGPNIPGAYRIRAVNSEQKEIPKLDTKDDVVKAYPKLFSGLGKLKGEYTIRLRDDAKPFCLYTPRRVPLPLMKKVEDEINGLVKSGVIESVDEPTDWCAPMVVVPKPNGNVRLCVDLTKLNEGVRRELYVMKKVVLQRLKDSGIMLNPDKCLFSTSRLQYLGQVIDSDGIRKDPAKIRAITELPEPEDVPDVRRFLGMVNQQRKFLPNLAEMTKLIRDLLKRKPNGYGTPRRRKPSTN